MTSEPERAVAVFPSRTRLDDVMLEEWERVSRAAVRREGRFVVALSGGRDPAPLFGRLAASKADLPWDKTHVFQADEHCVPKGYPESNLGMIERALLQHVAVPPANVHPVPVDRGAERAAEEYEAEMRRFFGPKERGTPRFDLILLGLGADGHTASLFPGDPALAEKQRWAVAVARPEPEPGRVTLTLPVIGAARAVVFLVTGEEKAAALKAVLEGPPDGLPAARAVSRQGRTAFLVDKAAGSLLSGLLRAKRRP